MKIQQENIHEYPKICKIWEHFLSWTIPIIQYVYVTVIILLCEEIYYFLYTLCKSLFTLMKKVVSSYIFKVTTPTLPTLLQSSG